MGARGRGVGEVGAPRGAIASTLHSGEEAGESAGQSTMSTSGSCVHAGWGWGKLAHLEARSRRLSTAATSAKMKLMSPRRVCRQAQAWSRALRGRSPSLVPAGGLTRLQSVLASRGMGFQAGWVFKRRRCREVRRHIHQDKYFDSREPGRVPHWVEKDTISTFMDLDEKMTYSSDIHPAYWPMWP